MKRIAFGLAVAFGVFAACFALHIVGGATGQEWLFATAVVLIFLTAAGYPAIALAASRLRMETREGRWTLLAGMAVGDLLTASALWAAAGRSLEWWQPFLAAVIVGGVSMAMLWGMRGVGLVGMRSEAV